LVDVPAIVSLVDRKLPATEDAYDPEGQLEQAEALAAEYWPAEQLEHAFAPASEKEPAKQLVQALELDRYWPPAQAPHAWPVANWPEAQADRHTLAPEEESLPEGHEAHAVDAVAPVVLEYFPPEQLVHEGPAPAESEYCPATQFEQVAAPAAENAPSAQLAQAVEDVDPVVDRY